MPSIRLHLQYIPKRLQYLSPQPVVDDRSPVVLDLDYRSKVVTISGEDINKISQLLTKIALTFDTRGWAPNFARDFYHLPLDDGSSTLRSVAEAAAATVKSRRLNSLDKIKVGVWFGKLLARSADKTDPAGRTPVHSSLKELQATNGWNTTFAAGFSTTDELRTLVNKLPSCPVHKSVHRKFVHIVDLQSPIMQSYKVSQRRTLS